MFDEYFNPLTSVASLVLRAAASRPVDLTGSPSSTFIDQDEPSTRKARAYDCPILLMIQLLWGMVIDSNIDFADSFGKISNTKLGLEGIKAQKASRDEFYIKQCLKGLGEGSGITLEVPGELVHKRSNEGAGVNLEVPNESNSSSSSSSSDFEVAVEDISSDEDKVIERLIMQSLQMLRKT
nr:hypothetical protein [Tanacetum cinerariifolium]